MRTIKVSDLKDQTGVSGPHPTLHCDECWQDFSANKSDYWALPNDHVFTCCGEPMRLVQREVQLVDVELPE